MLRLSGCVCLLVLVPVAMAADDDRGSSGGTVKLTKGQGTVEVTVDGQPFTTFHYGDDLPKPYFAPVLAPGGVSITRPVEMGIKEHPHHKGIWLAVDEVNGIDYWGEKGKILTAAVELEKAEGSPAVLGVTNHWLGTDGKPALIETTLIRIHPNRVIAYDIFLRAAEQPVTFGDTKEGLLAIRLTDALRERGGTGHVVTSDGTTGTRSAWGKPYEWIDYDGTIDGQTYGAALFDHPKNFRPSRYHVRDYGLFSINPFGEKAYTNGKQDANELTLKPGEDDLRLRYALYIHKGDTQQADVAAVYRQWVKDSSGQ